MTNQEAIRWLKLDIDMMKFDPSTGEDAYLNDDAKKTLEALDMAIAALRNEQKADDSLLKSDPDSVSKDDVIYRKAAVDALCAVCGKTCDKNEFVYNAPQDEQVILCPEHYCLCTLPSAQLEPNTALYTDGFNDGYAQCKRDTQDTSAQPNLQPTCNNLAIDCISRKAAIDVIRKLKAIIGTSDDEILLIDKAEAMTELMMMPSIKWLDWSEI